MAQLALPKTGSNTDSFSMGTYSQGAEPPSCSGSTHSVDSSSQLRLSTVRGASSSRDPTLLHMPPPIQNGNPYFQQSIAAQAIALLTEIALEESEVDQLFEKAGTRLMFDLYQAAQQQARLEADATKEEIRKAQSEIEGAFVQMSLAMGSFALMSLATTAAAAQALRSDPSKSSSQVVNSSTSTEKLPAAELPSTHTNTVSVGSTDASRTSATGQNPPTAPGTAAAQDSQSSSSRAAQAAGVVDPGQADPGSAAGITSASNRVSNNSEIRIQQEVDARNQELGLGQSPAASQLAAQPAPAADSTQPLLQNESPQEPLQTNPSQPGRIDSSTARIQQPGGNNPSESAHDAAHAPSVANSSHSSELQIGSGSSHSDPAASSESASSSSEAAPASSELSAKDLEELSKKSDERSQQPLDRKPPHWTERLQGIVSSAIPLINEGLGESIATIIASQGQLVYLKETAEIERAKAATEAYKELLKTEVELFQTASRDIKNMINETLDTIKQIARQSKEMGDLSRFIR